MTRTLSALFMAVLLLGCRSEKESAQPAQCPDEAVVAVDDGELDPVAGSSAKACGSITLWGGSFPKSLNYWTDPNSHTAEVAGLMFESLATLHSTEDRWIGVLAEHWETSADGMEFVFHIDSRARWSDGRQVTAADVLFYYDVIMDPKNLTPVMKVELERLERPVVIDSLTLKVRGKSPHWANFSSAAGLVAFPKHVWEGKDFNQVRWEFPVVSGPYAVREVKKERSVELSRRPDWWGRHKAWNQGKYNFLTIRYRYMDDRVKALEALRKGDLDAYAIYTSSIWMKMCDSTTMTEVRDGYVVRQRVYNQEPIGFQGFAINMRRPQFQDVRVRQALGMLLDRGTMNDKFMYNQYFLLDSYFPDLWPGNSNPDAPKLLFNPDSARKLLAEAGWKPDPRGVLTKDGKPFRVQLLTSAEDLRHYTRFQEDLKSAGIEATIEQVSWSQATERLDNFDFDLYWVNWSAGRLRDPESQWLGSAARQNGSYNYPGLEDRVVDSLIVAQRTEMDLAKRNDILREIDRCLVALSPYILLWQADHHRILYWNRYGTPASVFDKFGREEAILAYWWYDPAEASALETARKSGKRLPVPVYDIHWKDGVAAQP